MSDKLKILQLGRYFPPHIGGTEKVISDLTKGLNLKGHSCDVLCCNEANRYSEEIEEKHKIYRTKRILKFGSIGISPQQIFKLRQLWPQYQVIQLHHPAPMATLALWLVRPTCKIVVLWHSDIVRQKLLLLLFKPWQKWLLKRADAIVATTPNYIVGSECLKLYPHKTAYIPLGIAGLSPQSNGALSKLRSDFEGKKIIFSLGRLVEYKGYSYLIDAATYLSDNYIILIGGEGRLKSRLTRQIEQKGLQNKVKLLGKLTHDEVSQYFEMCNLFCLPSITKNEAFGLVLLEAMSMRKPIVATQIPGSGVSWVNQEYVSGLNVPVKDPGALAGAIHEILANQEVENRYKKQSWERFNAYFTKDTMVEAFIKLYQKLLSAQ